MIESGEQQRAIAQSAFAFCRDHASRNWREIWKGLAELGILSLGTAESGTGALDISAAMEVLGAFVMPGPLCATFIATQLQPSSELASGAVIASVGRLPWMPWASEAQLFIEIDGTRAWRIRPTQVENVETLGGEPSARVSAEREASLGDAARALAIGDVAAAAFLTGASERLADVAAEHARTRRQFGKTLAEFQAVSHPLASCALKLTAATALTRSAARKLDANAPGAAVHAAVARRSACRAALETVHVAAQVLGAIGMTADGPVFPFARRIRQLASEELAPGTETILQSIC